MKFHNGSEYIGQFMNNEIEGNGIFTDHQGNKYQTVSHEDPSLKTSPEGSGCFVKGKLYGKGEIIYK